MNEKIVRLLISNGIIDAKETELYQYGLGLLTKKIVHSFMILSVGLIAGNFFGVLCFLITYASIREYAGGYHAKTEIGCYCCTGIVIVCVLTLLYLFEHLDVVYIWFFLLVCGIIIWFLSPQESHNKPLVMDEKLIYRNTTRKYLVISGVICLFCFISDTIIDGITCAWITQAGMLLAGLIVSKNK